MEDFNFFFFFPSISSPILRMSVLSHNEILNAIKEGDIVITPFDESAVGPASIDLTLGNSFRTFKENKDPIELTEATDYKELTELHTIKEGETFPIYPGQTVLSSTLENVKISDKYCALLEGRSRFARLGIFVHITASFMNPGINSHQVLEIYNSSNRCFLLKPGVKLCQMIFMEMKGKAVYQGQFIQNNL